jgi:SAM-dependent methyltransferase
MKTEIKLPEKLKKNVEVFNNDVALNGGYKYTTNNPYSTVVANKRLTDVTIEALSNLTQNTLVDIGCGDGFYTAEIKNNFPNLKIDAFDPALMAVDFAKKTYPDINFFVANILDEQSLPKEKYETAIIRGVLHHLDYPELALINTAKIANQIIIIDPNGNNPILKIIEKKSKYHIEHEEKSYSEKQFIDFCKKSGCQIDKIYYVGFVPFFFPTIPAKIIHFFQPIFEKVPVLNYFLAAQIIIIINNKKKKDA